MTTKEMLGRALALPVCREGKGMDDYTITPAKLRWGHDTFEKHEPRDLFYRVATELISLATGDVVTTFSFSVPEALAVLLQTWNSAYYRYHKFDEVHFKKLERLIKANQIILEKYRGLTIATITDESRHEIESLFHEFEDLLGPVGAAKALHLLAPRVCPLWDRAIAKGYNLPLRRGGLNSDSYWKFLLITQKQCLEVTQVGYPAHEKLIKLIDEYNYCTYTKQLPS
jgi:hypothetical protein